MSINIGGVDPVQAIIDLELRVSILEALLEKSINNQVINDAVVAEARKAAMIALQGKYKHLGLEFKHA